MAVKAVIEAGAKAAGKAAGNAAGIVAAGKMEVGEAAEATGWQLQVAMTAAKATERFALRACREMRPPAVMLNLPHTEGDAQRPHS